MKTRTYRIILDTRKRILLKTMMSLASIATTLYQILSQFGILLCTIPSWVHTEDKQLILSGPSTAPIRIRKRFCIDQELDDETSTHYDRISVLACFSVDSRIRCENGSVDANRSMRLRKRIHLKTQWCGEEHLLNKSESQKNDVILPIRRHQDLRTDLHVFWSSLTWCSSSYFIRVFYFACVSFAGIFIRATLASHFFPNVNSHENIHYVQCSNLLYYRNISM
jgi:hypothetical protein